MKNNIISLCERRTRKKLIDLFIEAGRRLDEEDQNHFHQDHEDEIIEGLEFSLDFKGGGAHDD